MKRGTLSLCLCMFLGSIQCIGGETLNSISSPGCRFSIRKLSIEWLGHQFTDEWAVISIEFSLTNTSSSLVKIPNCSVLPLGRSVHFFSGADGSPIALRHKLNPISLLRGIKTTLAPGQGCVLNYVDKCQVDTSLKSCVVKYEGEYVNWILRDRWFPCLKIVGKGRCEMRVVRGDD